MEEILNILKKFYFYVVINIIYYTYGGEIIDT
jgi:hypothetical protein